MRVGVLGPFAVWQHGVVTPTPRRRALLSLLLVEDGPVATREIARSLWGEDHPIGTVQVLVHRLRRWLTGAGLGEIHLTQAGYHLDVPTGAVDIGRFRELVAHGLREPTAAARVDALADALALWRGPVLSDAPEAVRNRRGAHRLRALRHDTVLALAVACLTVGRPDRALPFVDDVAADSPFDERMQALQAFVLAACGRRAEALWLLDRVRESLDRELAVTPGPFLRVAQQLILDHELGASDLRTLVRTARGRAPCGPLRGAVCPSECGQRRWPICASLGAS
jgi:DNA-binding SARP family transcriptional activator